uniref:Putative conserved plasma membrane protein n=1 Tax=Corethrella appendiculata TaxID=1370023 RepID=U5ENI4_9DIPT
MSLSKPIYNLLGAYFEQLFNHPIRTKALTSCVIATTANYTSQKIAGVKKLNTDSILAYGLFGLIFGGNLPHFFYQWLERITQNVRNKQLIQFLAERFMFTPVMAALSLYFITRFEGRSHEDGVNQLIDLYKKMLLTNWKFLSLPLFLNFKYVPPMLRVLVTNLIGFCWIIFVANKRRKADQKRRQESS